MKLIAKKYCTKNKDQTQNPMMEASTNHEAQQQDHRLKYKFPYSPGEGAGEGLKCI